MSKVVLDSRYEMEVRDMAYFDPLQGPSMPMRRYRYTLRESAREDGVPEEIHVFDFGPMGERGRIISSDGAVRYVNPFELIELETSRLDGWVFNAIGLASDNEKDATTELSLLVQLVDPGSIMFCGLSYSAVLSKLMERDPERGAAIVTENHSLLCYCGPKVRSLVSNELVDSYVAL